MQVTRTPNELTVVCDDACVPSSVKAERARCLLRVEGSISFDAVGVVAGLALPLAEAHISIIVLGSCVTDYIVVAAADLDATIATLSAAGHHVTRE